MQIPSELEAPGTLYVMISDEAMAYVVPAFPASDVFIRIDGNLPLTPQTGLGQSALEKIKAHQGEIRSLSLGDYDIARSEPKLQSFGLAPGPGPCVPFKSKSRRFQSCPLFPIGD